VDIIIIPGVTSIIVDHDDRFQADDNVPGSAIGYREGDFFSRLRAGGVLGLGPGLDVSYVLVAGGLILVEVLVLGILGFLETFFWCRFYPWY
jgi:hypothetical protein